MFINFVNRVYIYFEKGDSICMDYKKIAHKRTSLSYLLET